MSLGYFFTTQNIVENIMLVWISNNCRKNHRSISLTLPSVRQYVYGQEFYGKTECENEANGSLDIEIRFTVNFRYYKPIPF